MAPDESRAGGDLLVRRAVSYETPRPEVQALVPLSARRILDLGCSSGALGEALKRRQAATVVGVELVAEYAVEAARRLDRVVTSDIDGFLTGPPPEEAPFDCLIAADVLEHLVDPWDSLTRAAALLTRGATAVISVPNISYWHPLWTVIRSGRWPREDFGISTARTFAGFTHDDALQLIRQAGMQSVTVDPRCPGLDGWRLSPPASARGTDTITPLSAYSVRDLCAQA
jgi:predicted TPR repeat methyltransferase